MRDGKAWLAIKCKVSGRELHPGLRYLCERVPVGVAVQLTEEHVDHVRLANIGQTEVHSMSAAEFLQGLT